MGKTLMGGLKVTTNFHYNRIKVTIIQNILDPMLQLTIELTHMITRSSNPIKLFYFLNLFDAWIFNGD